MTTRNRKGYSNTVCCAGITLVGKKREKGIAEGGNKPVSDGYLNDSQYTL